MRLLAVLLLCAPLSGCWFVYIPGSFLDAVGDGISGSFGNACIGSTAVVGGKVRTPGGGTATVDKISGTSVRCKEPSTPIRAQVTYDT